jgi:hypothetical protein
MIAVAPTSLAGTPVGMMTASMLCLVRLVDRRTGQAHRINGAPLTLFTRDPDEAAAELLRNRDPRFWEVRVEPIGGVDRNAGGRA